MARMSPLQVGRLVALLLVTFFSSVVLAILAELPVAAEPRVLLSIVVAALSVLTICTLILLDIFWYKVTVLSFIVSEIIWFGILSLAWLIAALLLPLSSPASCKTRGCRTQIDVSRVLAFLSFVILLPYITVLLTTSARLRRSSDRPVHVWTGSVRDVFAPGRPLIALARPCPSPPPPPALAVPPLHKSGFGFVVEQDDDPFHPEPVSSRTPSLLLSPTSPTSPRRISDAFGALPRALPAVHLRLHCDALELSSCEGRETVKY